MFKYQSSAFTDVGRIRENNEDSFLMQQSIMYCLSDNDGPCSFAVFDGMGGEQCGEIASSLASELLRTTCEHNNSFSLKRYIFDANRLICDEMLKRKVSRMGSTAAIVRLSVNKTEICNIGDSRVMAFKDGALFQLSQDHRTEMDGRKGVLTQHLGVFPDEFELEPYMAVYGPPKTGTIFILCTDGLTDMVSKEEITAIINSNKNSMPETICKNLIDAALINGGKDNVTVIVVKVE